MKMKLITIVLVLLASALLLGKTSCSTIERKFLFYPTHRPHDNSLTPWTKDGRIIGYAHQVASPKNVWLMLHGNAGQASDRTYAIPSFSSDDSVYILEYPGYGNRQGTPSKLTFNEAAKEAYELLRKNYPAIPICVISESIGSGPASFLATLNHPPDKLVLIVPFDKLSLVAEDHFPPLLVRLLLKDDWDNTQALANYKKPIEIISAESDTIITAKHARALAAAIAGSRMKIIAGGHNDWSCCGRVAIRNP